MLVLILLLPGFVRFSDFVSDWASDVLYSGVVFARVLFPVPGLFMFTPLLAALWIGTVEADVLAVHLTFLLNEFYHMINQMVN